MEGLINGGKLSFQNRLGLYLEENLRLKIGWANLWLEGKFMSVIYRKVLLTRLEDIDLCKTQPWKHFVYMDQGNPSQE